MLPVLANGTNCNGIAPVYHAKGRIQLARAKEIASTSNPQLTYELINPLKLVLAPLSLVFPALNTNIMPFPKRPSVIALAKL